MKILKTAFIFAAGIGVGVVGSMTYFKEKYEKYANEEIESVRNYYRDISKFASDISKMEEEFEDDEEESSENDAKYKDIIRRVNYNSMAKDKIANETWRKEVATIVEEKNVPKDDIPEEPFEITLSEFEEFDPYFEKVMLSYYEDGILTDDRDEIVDDIDRAIGTENFEKFLNNDMDSIYIRNPKLSIDYEIDRVLASYKEMGGNI